MENQQKKAVTFGVLIPVQELGKMKVFYRDILKLGDPVVDSNFWIEFTLPGNGLLILEQTSNTPKSKVKQGQSWLMAVDAFDDTVKRLDEQEVWRVRPPLEVPGYQCATYADPEGNLFTLYAGRQGD